MLSSSGLFVACVAAKGCATPNLCTSVSPCFFLRASDGQRLGICLRVISKMDAVGWYMKSRSELHASGAGLES